LKQAEEELGRAKANINSLLKYKALMAVILLEQGRTVEGEQLKDEVFKADSISVQLRNNLARYYFAREDYPKMLSELLVIYRNHPGDVDASLTNMAYYLKIGDYQKAFWCCEYVVKCQPSNEKAKQVLEELKGKLKQTPAK
jgi:tetratricopeptide (TPR) repeat protein